MSDKHLIYWDVSNNHTMSDAGIMMRGCYLHFKKWSRIKVLPVKKKTTPQ